MSGFEEAAAIAALSGAAEGGAAAGTAAALPAAGMAATGAGVGGMGAALAPGSTLGASFLSGGNLLGGMGAGEAASGSTLGEYMAAQNGVPMAGGLLGPIETPTAVGSAEPSLWARLSGGLNALGKGAGAFKAAQAVMAPGPQAQAPMQRLPKQQFTPSAPPVGTPAVGLLSGRMNPQQLAMLLRQQRGY